jgi:NADH dehydrogenase
LLVKVRLRAVIRLQEEATMILVVGATGLLGFEICRQLREAGQEVRALVRAPTTPRVTELAALGAHLVKGDLKQPASLRSACTGISVVVTTATATSRKGGGDTIETVDRDGQLTLVRAAADAGVRRFVYISAAPTRCNCPFLRYKREVEDAVRTSGMQWVILQPTAFMDIWLSPVMGWDLEKGRARLLGKGEARSSFIHAGDVAAFAVLASTRPDVVNRELLLGGPEGLSGLDVLGICEQVTGRTFSVQRVPRAVLAAVSLLLRPIDTKTSSLLAMGAATAKHGHVVEMGPLLAEFPLKLTSVRTYVEKVEAGRSAARQA